MKSEKTSVVMLGSGFIGQMHALSLRLSQFALSVGKVHPRLSCLIETPAGFEQVSLQDWTQTLSATDCDLFVNAGPNHIHVDPSIAFARAGKHPSPAGHRHSWQP